MFHNALPLPISIRMKASHITKGFSQFADVNEVQNVLEVTDFKPVFTEHTKFLKNMKLPLAKPHIRTKLDNTENNKRIILINKLPYISIPVKQYQRPRKPAQCRGR
jgi:hypothetical protein